MASKVSFRWLLTLLALIAPAAICAGRDAGDPDGTQIQRNASADVVFRHYF